MTKCGQLISDSLTRSYELGRKLINEEENAKMKSGTWQRQTNARQTPARPNGYYAGFDMAAFCDQALYDEERAEKAAYEEQTEEEIWPILPNALWKEEL